MQVFDFDNTIYDGESMVDVFKYALDKKPELSKYKKYVDLALKLYEHNMLPMGLVKSMIAKHAGEFNYSTSNIDKHLEEFWKINKHKLNKDIIKLIKKDDVIITATIDILIKPIMKDLKTKNIICSEVDLEKKEMKFMCYKENKVAKFKELYPDGIIDVLYTDSYADKPLMAIAKKVVLIDKNTKEMKVIKE